MGLTPREENPFSHEGNLLGMAWELMKARRLGDAALALEAACRVRGSLPRLTTMSVKVIDDNDK